MSALYRSVLFHASLKEQICLTQVRTFGYRALARSLTSGNTARTPTTTGFRVMASKPGKRSLPCSRLQSSSTEDGAARVKRVSIEGNIGKWSLLKIRWVFIRRDVVFWMMSSPIAVGKSTLAKLLQSACPDLEVVTEPVNKWQNIETKTSKVVSHHVYSSSSRGSNLTWCPPVSLAGSQRGPSDHSQQPAPNDVRRPSTLVVHVSDIFVYEPAEDAAAASSGSPAQLRGNTCPSVWALGLQRQVRDYKSQPPQMTLMVSVLPTLWTRALHCRAGGWKPGISAPLNTARWSCLSRLFPVRYIFALNMFELGCINSTEWAVYQDWHSFLVQQFGQRVELEGIIYLRAPPKVWAWDFILHPKHTIIMVIK